jgi:hypothetical protein
MVPAWGLIGAVIAFVISRIVEGTYLAVQAMRIYEVPLSQVARWRDLGKILAAAVIAGSLLYLPIWAGLLGVIGGALVFGLVFLWLLRLAAVPEVLLGLRRAHSYSRSLLARLQT